MRSDLLCVPLINFEYVSRFYKIQRGDNAIEVDDVSVFFNPVSSATRKWGTIDPLRWMQNFHQSTCDHEFFFLIDLKRANKFKHIFSAKTKQKYERGGR
jgi:hypothetical protein